MVLIRKRYFVQHLESLKRREYSRTKIKNRLLNILPMTNFGNNEKISINVKGPSRHGTRADSNPNRIHAGEGIGAALVGTYGMGMGIALNIENNNNVQEVQLLQDGNSHAEIQSPKSITASFEFPHHDGSRGVVADAHSFTSSPRSANINLPTSPGAHSGAQVMFSPYSNRSTMRNRRGGWCSTYFGHTRLTQT